MTKNDFITDYIVSGKGGLKEAETAWKGYREENGGTRDGFNPQLAARLAESPMTEEEYNSFVEEISPNPNRPYAQQHRWIWDMAQQIWDNQ